MPSYPTPFPSQVRPSSTVPFDTIRFGAYPLAWFFSGTRGQHLISI